MGNEAVSEGNPAVTAPATNEEGIRHAFSQLYRLRKPGWSVRYDKRADVLYVRGPNQGPAISYYIEPQPEILFRLDAFTGELTGMDFTEYRAVLTRADPTWGQLLRQIQVAEVLSRIPGFRRLGQRKERTATEHVEEKAQTLCPT